MSTFQAFVRISTDLRVVPQQITRRATAFEPPFLVQTLVGATVLLVIALVYIHAIENTVSLELVTIPARAVVTSNGIHADLVALVRILRALVHVGTSPVVVVQRESGWAAAGVTPVNVHALVLAIVNVPGALVHVRAIELVVLRGFQTFRAGAREATLQIHAGVRAQVQGALVRVHAAHLVLVDTITARADAYRPVLRFSALVGTGRRQSFAGSRAREIVLL